MRIIHGHDYYDTALAYGKDDRVVFVREKSKFITNNFKEKTFAYLYKAPIVLYKNGEVQRLIVIDEKIFNLQTSYENLIQSISIVFCGKIYTGIVVQSYGLKTQFFWNADAFQKWLEALGYQYTLTWNNRNTNLFEVKDVPKEYLGYLIENRITIITPDRRRLEDGQITIARINGDNLKDFQFFKMINPYQAFQEIEMWVGGVLPASGNPMVEITDNNIKIAKHGFDKKSFRKDKQI